MVRRVIFVRVSKIFWHKRIGITSSNDLISGGLAVTVDFTYQYDTEVTKGTRLYSLDFIGFVKLLTLTGFCARARVVCACACVCVCVCVCTWLLTALTALGHSFLSSLPRTCQ
jgi:hypothetical protein